MIGRCPKCGDNVAEGESSYFCRSSDCNFRIQKVIFDQPLDGDQVAKLLSVRRTGLLNGFVAKSGKRFSAFLVMDRTGKITFDLPNQESESEEEQNPKRDEEMECRPLLDTATKRLFRNNAFRITGLPVDAPSREITKRAEKLKMMAELGQAHPGARSVFALNPPPNIDDIREAIQKLKEPEMRIIDEFFWFWPEEFGSGDHDPALQAIARGELQTALDIWLQRERDHQNGVIARHNLWVHSQMMAIEHEQDLANSNDNNIKRQEADAYWQKASVHFHDLADDPKIWDKLKRRIHALDDARLKEDFAEQIKTTLPKALATISAELALIHSDKGNRSRASIQVRLARDVVGKNEAERILQALLVSNICRLREMARQAKENSDRDPTNASKFLFRLIETAKPLLEKFDWLLGNEHYVRNDMFDEVANACTNCAVDCQKKTGDDQLFLSLLENILPYAASSEARQRVNKNITIAKSNLAGKKLQPVFEKLSRITDSDSAPSTKLARINGEVVSDLTYYSTVTQLPTEAIDELSDSIAVALRSISVDLHNNHNDTEKALVAIDQAIRLAKDPELLKRVNEDRNQLRKMKFEQDSHNLQLSIRDDQIEITAKNIRYNSTNLPIDTITGIKFGIFTHYTNGVKTSVSYTIGLSSAGHGDIHIECKRFFRSEEQAKKDFEAILDSCFYHIIPSLVTRLAGRIAGGQELQLGDSSLSLKGIRATVGMLMWKEEIIVPWSDVRFGVHQGHLNLSSNQHKKFTKSYSLRDVWNAVIFEHITKRVLKTRS